MYLAISILFDGYFVMSGYGCIAVVPMLVHLGCLIFWGTSR